ncbi:hypothetical protein DFP73DRAFT_500434 [Morchella snyderi]|nr:hypothetical protein DFP73DRAFT_500434 [Morchella snyderi]
MPSYVITGAARGIGHEFVKQLSADANNTVFALVRNKSTSQKVVALARPNIHLIEADVANYTAVKAAAKEVSDITGGKLDVLIHNAADTDPEGALLVLSEYTDDSQIEHFTKTFQTNALGALHTANSFLSLLSAGTTRKAILISSGIASQPLNEAAGIATHVPYIISKTAANTLWWKYAIEFKDQGFTFLAMSPGYVDSGSGPGDEKEQEGVRKFEAAVKGLLPNFKGKITMEESVRDQLETIGRVGPEFSGKFVSQWGNQEWV